MSVQDVLQLLAAASLGAFVGAMLTEGCVLVPYWRALPPREFFAWYAANDRRLVGFFGPITVTTALLAIAAAVVSCWQGDASRWPALLAAGLTVVVVAMFPLHFRKVNAAFAAASIAVEDVPAALARWAAWHWVRTVLALVALGAALCAV